MSARRRRAAFAALVLQRRSRARISRGSIIVGTGTLLELVPGSLLFPGSLVSEPACSLRRETETLCRRPACRAVRRMRRKYPEHPGLRSDSARLAHPAMRRCPRPETETSPPCWAWQQPRLAAAWLGCGATEHGAGPTVGGLWGSAAGVLCARHAAAPHSAHATATAITPGCLRIAIFFLQFRRFAPSSAFPLCVSAGTPAKSTSPSPHAVCYSRPIMMIPVSSFVLRPSTLPAATPRAPSAKASASASTTATRMSKAEADARYEGRLVTYLFACTNHSHRRLRHRHVPQPLLRPQLRDRAGRGRPHLHLAPSATSPPAKSSPTSTTSTTPTRTSQTAIAAPPPAATPCSPTANSSAAPATPGAMPPSRKTRRPPAKQIGPDLL